MKICRIVATAVCKIDSLPATRENSVTSAHQTTRPDLTSPAICGSTSFWISFCVSPVDAGLGTSRARYRNTRQGTTRQFNNLDIMSSNSALSVSERLDALLRSAQEANKFNSGDALSAKLEVSAQKTDTKVRNRDLLAKHYR